VLDGASLALIGAIRVGSYPWGMGVNPDTNIVYAANYNSNTVSVIEDGYILTVVYAGSGAGTAIREPDLMTYAPGMVVTLWAARGPNSTFAGWSGGATGAANGVTITMNAHKIVTATFVMQSFPVTWTTMGTDSGLGSNTVRQAVAGGMPVRLFAATAGGLSISTPIAQSSRSALRGARMTSGDGLAPATGEITFTNKTISDGLGSNSVMGVTLNGNTVYAATEGGLSISTDGGNMFKNTTSGLASVIVNGVYTANNTLYLATAGGLAISTDGGNTFANRTIANGLGSNAVNGVYVNGNTVYAATAGGLSISSDGGGAFVNKTTADGLGSNTVNAVAAAGKMVYAGTTGGLSISSDGGNTFTTKTAEDGMGDDLVLGVVISGDTVYVASAGGLSVTTNKVDYRVYCPLILKETR
jgi:hypothetical protein